MWYNYRNDPAGATEEEARECAREEMSEFDLINCMVDYFGYGKYLRWCLSQENFWNEFENDIMTGEDIYFARNFTERNDDE